MTTTALTLEEYEALDAPEHEMWELVDGSVAMVPLTPRQTRLVVEVLSGSTARKDLGAKRREYADHPGAGRRPAALSVAAENTRTHTSDNRKGAAA